ncbi:MAG: response regulator transcription factor [Acidobacteriota bacterium]
MKQRVLVVEDDAALARVLRDNLAFEGFDVEVAGNGHLAIDLARSFLPDLVVLDLTLPDWDGFELFGLIRQAGTVPIIMLTARGAKADKIRGLHLGADDYVTKPFDLEELLARVHAVLRRSSPGPDQIVLGDVTVDVRAMTVWRGAREIHLTHREFELLRYLSDRRSRVVHRTELLKEVWGYPDAPSTRSVDHAIARLRKKIEPDPAHPRFIHTVHGDGYTLTPEGRIDPPSV